MKTIYILAGLGFLLIQAAMLIVLVLCVSALVSLTPISAPVAAAANPAAWRGWRATASVQACLDGTDAALLRAVYPDAVCLR